jgi:hypothetical protein
MDRASRGAASANGSLQNNSNCMNWRHEMKTLIVGTTLLMSASAGYAAAPALVAKAAMSCCALVAACCGIGLPCCG